jgi:flagellar biosynthesis component FlhA
MILTRAFTEHPASVGESYTQHCVCAAGFGARMVLGGIACMIHAVLPFMFVRTGSRTIAELNERMILSRRSASGSLPNTSQPSS